MSTDNSNLNQKDDLQNQEPRSRADINRENAQSSTGPRTLSGKEISSQNAVKHGCFRRPTAEDQAKVEEIFRTFCRDFRPEGMSEQIAVRQMAEAWHNKLKTDRWYQGLMDSWYTEHPCQSEKMTSPEATMEEYAAYKANKKDIDNFNRLQERFANRYDKCWRRLRTLQAERQKDEARLKRTGDDRQLNIPREKGKLHDTTFGLLVTMPIPQNEAILASLKTPRKVEPPPEEEKQ